MPLATSSLSLRSHASRTRLRHVALPRRRPASSSAPQNNREPSAHAQFYSDMLPGMVPVALLGSAIFLGLRLLQGKLSHERYLDEATARVAELEHEVQLLRAQRASSIPVDHHIQQLDAPHGEANKRGWFW